MAERITQNLDMGIFLVDYRYSHLDIYCKSYLDNKKKMLLSAIPPPPPLRLFYCFVTAVQCTEVSKCKACDPTTPAVCTDCYTGYTLTTDEDAVTCGRYHPDNPDHPIILILLECALLLYNAILPHNS